MIRLTIAALLILSGMFVLGTAALGLFRFSTTLNRMHAAALCDTLGALLTLSGLAVLSGMTLLSLKLALAVALLWLCNSAASHLIAQAEVAAYPNLDEICDRLEITPEGRLAPERPKGGERA